jgi:tetratricopeptide (TPR) repeat protein
VRHWKPGWREFFQNAAHWVPISIEAGWKFLTGLARAVVIFLFCAAIYLTIRQISQSRLIIEPISVPKQFEDAGLTSEVISNRIQADLEKIEAGAVTGVREEWRSQGSGKFAVPSDQAPYSSVEVPGTTFNLNSAVEVVLAAVRIRQPDTVNGEVTFAIPTTAAGMATAPNPTSGGQITLRIKGQTGIVEQVTMLAESNDLDASIEQASKGLLNEEDPYPLGLYWLSQGKPDSAIEIAQRLSLNGGTDKARQIAALNLWAAGLAGQGKWDDAIKKFQHVLGTLDANSLSAYNGLGIVYMDESESQSQGQSQNQSQVQQAIKAFQKAVELGKKSPAAHANLANAYSYEGDFKDANAEYAAAAQLDPGDAKPLINWAISLSDQKQYSQADENFQQAQALDPNNAELYFRWGISLSDRGNYLEASKKFSQAIQLNPGNDQAHNDLGVVLYDQHKYSEAADEYRKAIELLEKNPVPNYTDPYNNWGRLLLDQHRWADAIAKFKQALAIDADNADATNYWGRALAGMREYDQAIAKYQEVIAKHPQDPYAYKNWGDTLVAEHRFAEAVPKYQQALALNPGDEDAKNALQVAQAKSKEK